MLTVLAGTAVFIFSPFLWTLSPLGAMFPESELWILVADVAAITATGLLGRGRNRRIATFAKLVVIGGVLQFPLFLLAGVLTYAAHPF